MRLAIAMISAKSLRTVSKRQLFLARLAGLTRRQLHRLFREHFGQCPSEYYRSLRLRQARLMLQNPARSIVEAAEATGFSTHSHFTKCYRQQFGVPPRLDRQNI